VVVNKYQNNPQLSVNKNSAITASDAIIETVPDTKVITGFVTSIMRNSGFIMRCPECNKPLKKGACTDHGKVEGVNDIRLMMVIDDGKKTYNINCNRKLTEELMKITVDEATEIVRDTLDAGSIRDMQVALLEGRYVTAEVMDMQSRYLNACEVTPLGME